MQSIKSLDLPMQDIMNLSCSCQQLRVPRTSSSHNSFKTSSTKLKQMPKKEWTSLTKEHKISRSKHRTSLNSSNRLLIKTPSRAHKRIRPKQAPRQSIMTRLAQHLSEMQIMPSTTQMMISPAQNETFGMNKEN